MAGVHDDFVDLAYEMIEEDGRPIQVIRTVIPNDPSAPEKTGTPVVTVAGTVGAFFTNESAALNVALLQAIGAPEGARTTVLATGTQCFVPAKGLPFDINADCTIKDGDKTWTISDVELIKPGPTAILFICDLRA
jgi:hypothetical protein